MTGQPFELMLDATVSRTTPSAHVWVTSLERPSRMPQSYSRRASVTSQSTSNRFAKITLVSIARNTGLE